MHFWQEGSKCLFYLEEQVTIYPAEVYTTRNLLMKLVTNKDHFALEATEELQQDTSFGILCPLKLTTQVVWCVLYRSLLVTED